MQRPAAADQAESDGRLYQRTVTSLCQLVLQHATHSHALQVNLDRLEAHAAEDKAERGEKQSVLRENLDASLVRPGPSPSHKHTRRARALPNCGAAEALAQAVASKTAGVAAEWRARAAALEQELAALTDRHRRLAASTSDLLALRADLPPLPEFADDYPGDRPASSPQTDRAAASAAGDGAARERMTVPRNGTPFVVHPDYGEPTLRIWRGARAAHGQGESAGADDVVAIIDNGALARAAASTFAWLQH